MLAEDGARARCIHQSHARAAGIGVCPAADARLRGGLLRAALRLFPVADQLDRFGRWRDARLQQGFAEQGIDEGGFADIVFANDHNEEEHLLQISRQFQQAPPVLARLVDAAEGGRQLVEGADATRARGGQWPRQRHLRHCAPHSATADRFPAPPPLPGLTLHLLPLRQRERARAASPAVLAMSAVPIREWRLPVRRSGH